MSPRTRHPAFLACLYLLSAPLNADSPAATATTQDNPGDLQTQARSNLAATEYEVSAQPGASCAPAGYRGTTIYQAPNRTHNLRSCFTADGVLVVPRIGEAGWHWGLMLAAYGDDSELHATTPSAPAVAGNRVEYTRGSVTEWVVNDANGLEQGFTLHESVTSEPATILRIGIRGDLQPAGQDGAIAFRSAGGVTVINYGQLKAWDAAGAVLPATMRLVGSAIELKIATAGANYPVTIDPVGTRTPGSA